ncbi:MAG TPA: sugar ABC transporter permease [Bacillota bacterium]
MNIGRKNKSNAGQSLEKGHIREWAVNYLWMLPAMILVFFFLVLPTLQTIYLSLHEKVTFSESQFTQDVLGVLKTESGREIKRDDLIERIPGWRKAMNRVAFQYKIKIAPGDINEEMTVKDTAEMLIVAKNQAQRSEGRDQQFAGLKNYIQMFTDSTMLTAFRNNLIWLLFFTVFTVILGLLVAALADRVRWSTLAKTIIFLPMAISGAAAAVIWNFMYFKDVNTGTINGVINAALHLLQKIGLVSANGFEGIAFLGRPDLVNLALIAAGVWMQVGFSTVIFSAALKSVPVELIEMAHLEGAGNLQIFFKIEIPIIQSTIVLVITQMIMWVLKVFDIIYTLTKGGPFHTSEVVANRMYMTAFSEDNFQYAAAMAVVLFIAVLPVLFINIRNLAYEESVRE